MKMLNKPVWKTIDTRNNLLEASATSNFILKQGHKSRVVRNKNLNFDVQVKGEY